jgi:hypothetical protein
VPTIVRDPQPVEFEALFERRRRLGQDQCDEVVMSPGTQVENYAL